MTSTDHEATYDAFTERLLRDLSSVTSRDSARRFARDNAKLVRRQEQQTPDFDTQQFLDTLKDALVARMSTENDALMKEIEDAKAEGDAATAEMTARMDAAKAAGDRDAQRGAAKERDETQRTIQARIDAARAGISALEPRIDAFHRLASALNIEFS